MSQHLEVREIIGDALLFERGYESMIGVQVGYDLETAFERDDLPFEVSLQDPKTDKRLITCLRFGLTLAVGSLLPGRIPRGPPWRCFREEGYNAYRDKR